MTEWGCNMWKASWEWVICFVTLLSKVGGKLYLHCSQMDLIKIRIPVFPSFGKCSKVVSSIGFVDVWSVEEVNWFDREYVLLHCLVCFSGLRVKQSHLNMSLQAHRNLLTGTWYVGHFYRNLRWQSLLLSVWANCKLPSFFSVSSIIIFTIFVKESHQHKILEQIPKKKPSPKKLDSKTDIYKSPNISSQKKEFWSFPDWSILCPECL